MSYPGNPYGNSNTTDPAATDLERRLTERLERRDATIEALRERLAEFETDKRAPVQGYSAGIPWSMHLRAYDVYCKKYSSQPALIDLEKRNCRGGFGTEELDEFIPGWRDELSKTLQLLRRAEAAETALELGATWGLASKGYDATTAIALADWINSGFRGDPPKYLLPTLAKAAP